MGYFFEVWLRGFAKDHLREMSVQDNENYHPHVTFIRPFKISGNDEEIKERVTSYCQGKEAIPFTLEGKGNFDGKVNYVPVTNSKLLLEFNNGLEDLLESLKGIELYEKLSDEKIFHATVNFGKEIEECPKIDQYMLRLTGIRDSKIWFSYDFVTQKVLNREESLDKNRWYGTVHSFSEETGLLPTRQGYMGIK